MRRPGFVLLPKLWLQELRAMKANAATWNVAVELLGRARFSPVVKLSNEAAAKISRQSKWRALQALRKRGLVIVAGRSGTSPWAKVMFRD
jgi:hypothetical protein